MGIILSTKPNIVIPSFRENSANMVTDATSHTSVKSKNHLRRRQEKWKIRKASDLSCTR